MVLSLPKFVSETTIGTSTPSAKRAILLPFVPGSKPAATRSLFFTLYQPGCVTISLAAGTAATFHCCARRCAAGALGAGAVTPMPGCVTKMPPTEPADGSGSVSGVGVGAVLLIFGVTGPCVVCTPLRSTSSIQYCGNCPAGGALSTKR